MPFTRNSLEVTRGVAPSSLRLARCPPPSTALFRLPVILPKRKNKRPKFSLPRKSSQAAARKWHGQFRKGGREAVHAMSYVITIKAASVERELAQQGNNEEDSSNKKNRNEDERQNLLVSSAPYPNRR